jgi:hypothetical protein
MRLILGVDEAGYGPNMGPLVIAASLWRIGSDFNVLDGMEPFLPEFKAARWSNQSDFVPLGDSKKIYQPRQGLSGLSFTVEFFESMIRNPGQQGRPWFELANLAAHDIDRVQANPWYQNAQELTDRNTADVLSDSALIFAREKMSKLKIELLDFRLRVLDEAYFNDSVIQFGNKAEVLGQYSLNLAWQVLKDGLPRYPCHSIEIYCDRQGGRKMYSGLLTHTFENSHDNISVPLFSATSESSQSSCYSMEYFGIPTSIRFEVDGDSLFAPAASSIVAKWMREILMLRLNRYWQNIVGQSLKPTAGYAVDAARFSKEIEPWVSKLAIAKKRWWRER